MARRAKGEGSMTLLPDGSYRFRLAYGTGKMRKNHSKNVTAKNPKEAQKLFTSWKAEIIDNRYMKPSHMTLNDFSKEWLREYGKRNLSPKTYVCYELMLNKQILPKIGTLKLEEVTPFELTKFYNGLKNTKKKDAEGKALELAGSTKLKIHRILSSMFAIAVEWERIPSNPVTKTTAPKKEKQEAAVYDEEQITSMLAALDLEPSKYRMLAILALTSQMRRGELIALKWGDIDFKKKSIIVNKSMSYIPKQGMNEKSTKTGNVRAIAMPESVIILLEAFKAEQAALAGKLVNLWAAKGYIFTKESGEPMHIDTISSWWPEFIRRHDLPKITFHGLRHTGITFLAHQGINVTALSKRAGHSSPNVTLSVYSHALQSADRESANKIDGMFADTKNGKQAKK